NHWADFNAYEKRLDQFMVGQRMTVLCTYPIARHGAAEILDATNSHQFVIARRKGKWEMIEAAVQMQAEAEIKRLNEARHRIEKRTYKMPRLILNYGVAVLSVVVALIILFLMK